MVKYSDIYEYNYDKIMENVFSYIFCISARIFANTNSIFKRDVPKYLPGS